MKKAKKIVALLLCAVLLIGATIAGTVAYLMDVNNNVINTITIGEVDIYVDEAEVDEYGFTEDKTVRTDGNDYKLVPGRTYTKDPTIHVSNNSEPSYIFVQLQNGLLPDEYRNDIIDGDEIEDQILGNGWIPVPDKNGVYYQLWEGSEEKEGYTDLVIFEYFTIDAEATAEDLAAFDGRIITVTAHAIQEYGFADASEAWAAVNSAEGGAEPV